MDFGSALEKVVVPGLAGLAGLVGSALGFKHRLATLERDFERYKETIKEELETLKKAWRMELDDHKDDITDKIVELKKGLAEIEDNFEKFARASHHDFARDEEFTKFVEEVNKQWQQVQRTLGQIEGLIQTRPK